MRYGGYVISFALIVEGILLGYQEFYLNSFCNLSCDSVNHCAFVCNKDISFQESIRRYFLP